MPRFEVSGDVETLFDIEGGFSRSVKSKLDLKVSQPGGPTITETIETTSALDSMKALAPEDAAREAKVIRVFDAAGASICDGEYAKAAEALESLKPAEIARCVEGRDQQDASARSGKSGRWPKAAAPANSSRRTRP